MMEVITHKPKKPPCTAHAIPLENIGNYLNGVIRMDARCVRDCSGILSICPSRWKDIAESPTSLKLGTPKEK